LIRDNLASDVNQRRLSNAKMFWRRIDLDAKQPRRDLLAKLDIDPDGADAIVALLQLHPAARGERPMPVAIDHFSDAERGGPIEDMKQQAARLLVGGSLAIGTVRLDRGVTDNRLFEALIHVAFGIDDLDATLRDAILGRLNPLHDPPRDPFERFPRMPKQLVDLSREVERRTCLVGLIHAVTAMGAVGAVERWAQQISYRVWVDTIDGLEPSERYGGTEVTIRGKNFGQTQPANVSVMFPRASGGCAPVAVKTGCWGDTEIVVTAPEGVGDGAVGFLEITTPAGAPPKWEPSAPMELAGALVQCLGPMTAAIASRLSNWTIHLPLPPCPELRPDDKNHFRGGPVLVNLSSSSARAGDIVTAEGLNLDTTDCVAIDGVAANTTATSATTLDFVVPKVSGGYHLVTVVHGAHKSNGLQLRIRPAITGTAQSGPHLPGTSITLHGSGFRPGAVVQVNQQSVSAQRITPTEIDFQVFRPNGVARDKRGEVVDVQVLNPDGGISNKLALTLRTYRMVVFGDSISWGQGLLQGDKYSQMVADHIQGKLTGIGVYNDDVSAHSGATIGLDPLDEGPSVPVLGIDGEVPTSYPTIAAQVDSFVGENQAALGQIDLVLIDGGINDLGAENILSPDPLISLNNLGIPIDITQASSLFRIMFRRDWIKEMAQRQCYASMKVLLARLIVLTNARIIVTGYYPIVSPDSDITVVNYLLSGLGVAGTAGIALGPLMVPVALAGGLVGYGLSKWGLAEIAENAKTFATEANRQLQNAIDETLTAFPGRLIDLAVPSFGPRNALAAHEGWLWEADLAAATPPSSYPLAPRDPIAATRRPQCVGQEKPYRVNRNTCPIASLGHPNQLGALAYRDAIVRLLDS